MSYIPTPEEALEILKKYNTKDFHIQHAQTVSKVLGHFAREHDPGREDFWRTVGILHDVTSRHPRSTASRPRNCGNWTWTG